MEKATVDLMFSSKSNEYLTPGHIIDRALKFFDGRIDLDPASNSASLVPALSAFDRRIDGLKQYWYGRIWLNPPYGRELLPKFITKAIEEYKKGNAKEILILVPARTDTKWHRSLDEFDRCYLHGRLKFQIPGQKLTSAPFPSALFYLGEQRQRFVQTWEDLGSCFSSL
jgi:DNA N-6-adenine-methyltransferase (Dam)